MNHWKSIVGGLLAAVAVLTVGASTLDDPQALPRSTDALVMAAATFLSVVILHWLLWRFIIPSSASAPPQITAFFPPRTRRGFFSGTMSFGYLQVTSYCVELSGYLPRIEHHGRIGLLAMGLFLIGLATAARLRDVFSALSAPRERQHTNADG